MLALAFAVPASAVADDSGGVTYGSSNSSAKPAKPSSTRSTRPTPHRSGGRANWHLGDRVPMRQGMHGHDVRILQDFLGRIGIQLNIDGDFGHATWAALRRFERRAGRRVDGVLDAGDLAALRQVVDQGGWEGVGPDPSTTEPTTPSPTAGERATVGSDGMATAPADAPEVVQEIIQAGNEIATKPYRYGGGHGRWNDTGYDCSGSVSYALHGAGLLSKPLDSSQFESWGASGPGQWVTIYANGGHAYMVVAGLRFDTSGKSSAGTRWQTARRTSSGYVVRHPAGL